MTSFDPLRAQMEVCASYADIAGVLRHRMQIATTRLADAEAEMNAFAKLLAFVETQRHEARKKLAELHRLHEDSK